MALFQHASEETEQNQERASVRIFRNQVCIRTGLLHNIGLDQCFPIMVPQNSRFPHEIVRRITRNSGINAYKILKCREKFQMTKLAEIALSAINFSGM
jgi:hypothetical protein